MQKEFSIHVEAQKMVRNNLMLGVSRRCARPWAVVSIGTARTFRQTYINFLKWLVNQKKAPRNAGHQDGNDYLTHRTGDLCQVSLNRERIALQHHFKKRFKHHLSQVPIKQKMPRRYLYGEVSQLLSHVREKLGLSILICVMAGVRACELLSIARPAEQPESLRPWLPERFLCTGDGVAYTVKGKGGLVRVVMLPLWLSTKLEACRRHMPIRIKDRGIYRDSFYEIPGGHQFSNQFSEAAKTVLGFSHGAHGLRGTFAQVRLATLVKSNVPFEKARLIVAQELGHFSPANLRYYLPGSCFHKFLLKGGRCQLKAHDSNELKVLAAEDLHALANASIFYYK